MVIDTEGTTRIAQYGQWDGYPKGQGTTILEFIRDDNNQKALLEKLPRCRFIDSEGKDKELVERFDSGNETSREREWYKDFINRDIGGKILQNVVTSHREEILLQDNSDFANDSLFCEWAYVIDFSKNTFEAYKGFTQEPLKEGDRFYVGEQGNPEYHPVKKVVEVSLSQLPTNHEFYRMFPVEDD